MKTSPLAEQPKIVIFGVRNAGKSSLMNHLLDKEVAIVSDLPGTTTDPVTRSKELGSLGSCTITDAPGFDDLGKTGSLRTQRAWKTIKKADIIIFVSPLHKPLTKQEREFLLKHKDKPLICVLSYSDQKADIAKEEFFLSFKTVKINNLVQQGMDELKKELISLAPKIQFEITPVQGLVKEQDLVLLVTPIDLAAPKNRLILPQVETIRDLLDRDCAVMVVKERELHYFYHQLNIKPRLVITDSQVFNKVAADIPEDQALTSFSILFARKKGDLKQFIKGLEKLSKLKTGDSIFVLEACAHHKQADDIGRVKIPRLFRQIVNPDIDFQFARELPNNPQEYSLVISCGACMVTRNTVMNRMKALTNQGIPVINYGLFLAWANGLLPRALEPFEEEYDFYHKIFENIGNVIF